MPRRRTVTFLEGDDIFEDVENGKWASEEQSSFSQKTDFVNGTPMSSELVVRQHRQPNFSLWKIEGATRIGEEMMMRNDGGMEAHLLCFWSVRTAPFAPLSFVPNNNTILQRWRPIRSDKWCVDGWCCGISACGELRGVHHWVECRGLSFGPEWACPPSGQRGRNGWTCPPCQVLWPLVYISKMHGIRLLFIWLDLEAGLLDIAHYALNFWRLRPPRKDSTAADGLNSVYPWRCWIPDRTPHQICLCLSREHVGPLWVARAGHFGGISSS